MDPKKFRSKVGPEAIIQRNFIRFVQERGWYVERMIGNALQKGIPDIYICHPEHGDRWIDLKNPGAYEFTENQRRKWPVWETFGTPLWIITGADEENYDRLFRRCNWREYWKPKYDTQPLEPQDECIPSRGGPEGIIQDDFVQLLEEKGWHVERMIGNTLQMGVPDIYVMHQEHGARWIDLKNPHDYEFTRAQRVKWPRWEAGGIPIWIITGNGDYDKLAQPANWRHYWKPKYDEELEELEDDLQFLFNQFKEERDD